MTRLMTGLSAAVGAQLERFGDAGLVLGLLARGVLVLAAFWVFSAIFRKAEANLRHEILLAGLMLATALPLVVVAGAGGAWFVSMPGGRDLNEPPPIGENSEIRRPLAGRTSPEPPGQTPSTNPALERETTPTAAAVPLATRSNPLPVVWMLGMGTLLVVWAARWAAACLQLRPWVPVSEALRSLAESSAKAQGLRALPRLALSRGTTVPSVWGFIRPRVVLPVEALGWQESRLNMALRHEFAHLVRRDHLTRLVADAAALLHWPNPLAWLSRSQLAYERELSCDEAVIASGVARSLYARELLAMVRDLRPERRARGPLPWIGRSRIKQRIERALESPPTTGHHRLPRFATLLAIALLSLLVSSVYAAPRNATTAPGDIAAVRLQTMGGGDLRRLAAALRSGDWQYLRASGPLSIPRRATAPLLRALGDPDPRVRRIAAWALGETRSRRGRKPLQDALSDADASVRAEAALALGDVGGTETVPSLVRSLQDRDPVVRRRAAHALGDLRHPESLKPLVSALHDEREDVAHEVDWALRETLDAMKVTRLVLALDHPEARVRFHATHFLGDAAKEATVAPLVGRLDDPDPETRVEAAWALGEVADRAGLDALAKIAADPIEPTELRTMAIRGIGEIRQRPTRPLLAQLLADSDWRVRSQAADALGTIGGRGYREVLMAVADGDPHPEVRAVAAKAARRSR